MRFVAWDGMGWLRCCSFLSHCTWTDWLPQECDKPTEGYAFEEGNDHTIASFGRLSRDLERRIFGHEEPHTCAEVRFGIIKGPCTQVKA
jgi:hypothetical protein